jgi:preprotein translocase subunit SecG
MILTVLTIVHVIVCFVLILVVLLQSGKAADLAGAFGGMGSQTAFGPRGAATLLSKATTVCAIVFMLTSISLGILASRQVGPTGSVLEKGGTSTPAETSKPATPPAPPAQQPQPQQQQPANPKK